MTDKRFFRPEGPFTLGQIADYLGASRALFEQASANLLVRDLAELATASDGDLSLFSDTRHAAALASCHAGVVVTSEKLSAYPHNGIVFLLSENPRLTFARIGAMFYPRGPTIGRIHSSAIVSSSALIGEGVDIAARATIGGDAVIGARCRIGANSVIAEGVVLGEDCCIGANTTISHALIGNGVVVATNCSIGGEGFGFVKGPMGPIKVLQIGRVILEDGVEIGSNCAVDRGSLGDTVIGAMTMLDNFVQIGHNVRIGRACMIAGQAGVAGSTTIGDCVMVGGAASISDHLTIGTGAKIAGKSGVMRNVEPGETVAGYPAVPVRQWHRQTAALATLVNCKPADRR